MTRLADEHCARVTRAATCVAPAERDAFLAEVPAWRSTTVDGIERLEREFRFKDFAAALEFTNRIGALAEAEDHHPAILTQWGRVTVTWWTHAVSGLHRNDFVMAARTDGVYPTAMS
jgi:4a-hydroxytetrahydrobiopterin dehydratase